MVYIELWPPFYLDISHEIWAAINFFIYIIYYYEVPTYDPSDPKVEMKFKDAENILKVSFM